MTVAAHPASVTHKMTFEEFLEWDDEGAHAEWVDGEVEVMSPASYAHQNLISFLVSLLRFLAEARELGDVLCQPFVMKTGHDLPGREPDILFIAAVNLSRIQRNYLDGPADLAIEIVSPESQRRDREVKLEEYRQGGVPEYWLLDPTRNEAIFRQLQPDGTYRIVVPDAEGVYHSAAMPGLWINVNWLWQSPLPTLLYVFRQWGLLN